MLSVLLRRVCTTDIHSVLSEVLPCEHVDYQELEKIAESDCSDSECKQPTKFLSLIIVLDIAIQADSLDSSQILCESDKQASNDRSDSELYYSASSEADDDQN